MHRRDVLPFREAFTLPLLFLTVSLLAAVRVAAGGTVRFVGPTLLSLVLGVMLGGRYGDESTLISLSAQLETARPWAHRRPALW